MVLKTGNLFKTLIWTAVLLCGVSIGQASAALIIDATEIGGDVVFSASGSLNVTGLVPTSTTFLLPQLMPSAPLLINTNGTPLNDYFNVLTGISPFGPGGFQLASSRSGDNFGFLGVAS